MCTSKNPSEQKTELNLIWRLKKGLVLGKKIFIFRQVFGKTTWKNKRPKL
jgi:hypothetical protein